MTFVGPLLLTGATGFLGRYIVAALSMRREAHLRCLVRQLELARAVLGPRVELATGDLRDPAAVRRALEGAERVIHLAAIIRPGKRQGTFQEVNVQGTRNLLVAAKEAGVRHVVHMSILGAQESPAYPYGHSRWLGEQEVVQSGLPYTVLRSSLLFGPGDSSLTLFAASVRFAPVIAVAGDGKARFQPLAVQDAARCILTALDDPRLTGVTVGIGGPEQLTYDDLLDRVAATLGARRWKAHLPLPVLGPVAWLMERLPDPVVTRQMLKYLERDNVTDLDSVERWFGFAPKPIAGNIDYVKRVRWWDACRALLGFGLPARLVAPEATP